MNLTIMPGKATEDVQEIESIVNKIDISMSDLNDVITRIIPEHVETEWSNNLKDNWTKYYNGSIQSAMDEMRASAVNLQNAVNAALEYSKQ